MIKETISRDDCKKLTESTKPRFEAKSPFDQVCNVLLLAAHLFLDTMLRNMIEEANKLRDRGS